jgi:hypothetical protein
MRPNPNDVFTICTIEGRGRGIIANRDMSYGEVVLKEAPLLIMPPEMNQFTLALLPRKALESVLLLHNEKSAFFDVFDKNPSKDASCTLMHYLKEILATNSLAVGNDCHQSVLLLKGSLFNHSDHPNVVRVWDARADEMEFVTCEDIRKGEELMIDYAPDGWGDKRPDWYKGNIL